MHKFMNEQDALLDRLGELYSDSSKHSVYQSIPTFIQDSLNYRESINERWRGDSARWAYLHKYLDLNNRSILDIGANTGFFTLSLAHMYPESTCTALEGNANHAEFIELVKAHYQMSNVRVLHRYLDFAGLDKLGTYDTVLLFNVLHHAGVDFDEPLIPSRDDLYAYLVRYLTKLRNHCDQLLFQMGYNWGGNKQQPIVALANDSEKYIYTNRFLQEAGWSIAHMVATYGCDDMVPVYHQNLPDDVVNAANARDASTLRRRLDELLAPDLDTFSEFYRRPIFVCTRR
jgi:SAM-dependent methyltransferase